ncbi:MAG: GNAT family N-acetyltransferase [Pseudomonadota bacterium]
MSALDSVDVTLSGYYPGAIGDITRLHATYYHEHWGFDVSFESQVGKELSEFMQGFREDQDLLVTAAVNGHFAGSAAVNGQPDVVGQARLRWFIVRPDLQGLGLGQDLLGRALEFSKKAGFRKVILWTFQGLDSARRLYERAGFRLTEEHSAQQWGSIISEQKFVLDL